MLEINPGRLDAQVVVEPGDPADPGSEQFPHICGPIPMGAVVHAGPYVPVRES